MRELIKYAIAGVINTCIGYSVFWVCFRWLGLSASAANTLGYAVALLVAFQLNKLFVFSAAKPKGGAGWRFAVAFAGAFLLNQAILLAIIEFGLLRAELAQVVAMVTYSVIFFLATKYFVFQSKNAASAA